MDEFLAFVTAPSAGSPSLPGRLGIVRAETAWWRAERWGHEVYLAAFRLGYATPAYVVGGPYASPDEASAVALRLAAAGVGVANDTLIFALRHAPADVLKERAILLAAKTGRAISGGIVTYAEADAIRRLCDAAGDDRPAGAISVIAEMVKTGPVAAAEVACEALRYAPDSAVEAAAAIIWGQTLPSVWPAIASRLRLWVAGGDAVAQRLLDLRP